MKTLLLPGMDGTGALFDAVVRNLDSRVEPHIVSFPTDIPLSYDELLNRMAVPEEPFAVVAESFSGPLGIRLTHRYPDRAKALVLVASFARSPSILTRGLSELGPLLFRVTPPAFAVRWSLLGSDATDADVEAVRSAIRRVSPAVLAKRLSEIAAVDASSELASMSVPLLYIAGDADRLVGATEATRMRRIRPDMQIRTLPAPHLVLQRRPSDAGQLISTFLLSNLVKSIPNG